jgi:hypothetical protein
MLLIAHGKVTAITAYVEIVFARLPKLVYGHVLFLWINSNDARHFLVNKTNRRTEFQIYWYYDSTCFGQPFRPSSGVLIRTSALVHLCSFDDRLLPGAGWNCSILQTVIKSA